MKRSAPLLFVVVVLATWFVTRGVMPRPLVVYCAHDSMYAEGILREFQRQTGIAVVARYDTEATKSLGLVEQLVQEKAAPRCDVFWNNELLGTLDLQEKEVLAPYRGPGWERIPAKYRDPDGYWAGFAARMRVVIRRSGTTSEAADRFAIAKPLYGTTLTHYSLLWQRWGPRRLEVWHLDQRRRGAREFNGNAAVKDAVVAGVCDFGYTDTDDFFAAKGKPVSMAPVRVDGATICIPNTVAIIRGTRREADARRLVDFLLSAKTELALAHAESRQIPLGPVDSEQLPPEVREITAWAAEGAPLAGLLPARRACLEWLKTEYVK